MPRAKYTEDESILALLLYITIERKDIRKNNPEIVRMSTFLTESGYERTPGSLKAKLENFKAFDPMYGGSGMTHFSKTDRDVWDRFYATGFTDLADAAEGAAERISQGRKNLGDTIGSLSGIGGTTAVEEIKVRVNQEIFRSRVLEAYGFRCCITGIHSPGLIEACHIKNWSECPEGSPDRLDPRNGLCMDILHHRSFDRGMFTIDEQYKLELSPSLREKESEDVLERFYYPYEGKIIVPEVERFKPSQEFLDWHRKNVFVEGQTPPDR